MHGSALSAEYIVKESVTLEIEGVPYEFAVKASVFGELLSIENLFTQLPEEAQKLTIGKDHKKVLWRLHHFEKLFKYKLSLLLVDDRKPAGPLTNFLQTILHRREQLSLPPHTTELDRVRDEWTREFFSFCLRTQKQGNAPAENQAFLPRFSELFKTDGDGPVPAAGWFMQHHFSLAIPIVADLLHCLPQFRVAILQSLPDRKAPEILRLYLDLYKNHYDELHPKARTSLILGLQQYPVSEVRAIGWKILTTPAKLGKHFAFYLLKAMNVADADISRAILPVFYQLENMEQILEYLDIFSELRNHELAPSTSHLTGLFEKYCSSHEGQNLVRSISFHLACKPDFPTERKLRQWLEDESSHIQQAALNGMYDFVIQGGYRPSGEVISKLKDLFESPILAVRMKAVSLAGRVAHVIRDPAIVTILLGRVTRTSGTPDRMVLTAINAMLEYVPFPVEIVPVYLNLLKTGNDLIRLEALRGLRYSFDEDIRHHFKKMEAEDPAENVRMEAFRAWRFSKKRENQLFGDLPEPAPPQASPKPNFKKKHPQPENDDSFFSKMLDELISFFKN